jgi:signal transduction histidine kinase
MLDKLFQSVSYTPIPFSVQMDGLRLDFWKVTARVYVVDEDPLAAADLAVALEREAGLEGRPFSSARAALAAVSDAPPDALIASLSVAEADGVALLDQVQTIDADVACLLLAPAGDADAEARAMGRVGALRCARRPFELADLLPKLHAAIEHRELLLHLRSMEAVLAQREHALTATRRQAERTAAELESTSSELATATERLVSAEQLAAVGRVLGGIAHEISEQLALVGYAEALRSRVADQPELVELADVIVNAQKRLARMIDEIRDFVTAGADGSGPPLVREPADIASLIDEALALMRFDRDVRKRTLRREYRSRPLAAVHRQKLVQVVLNLVSNAVLATRPGDTVTVGLDADDDRGLAAITVADRGAGMTPEVLRHLGEPFFTTRARGSGLGVGICKRIVEEHGGQLTFESAVGRGTTARVTLPLLGAGS